MTDRKLSQGTAITTLAATDKFYIVPAGGTVPWGYITGANLAGYISAGAGTAMYPTGAFVTGGYLYFNGGTVLTDSNVITADGTVTFTNKRVTPRAGTVALSATPAINTDLYDYYEITGSGTITSMTTSLSGTPTRGQKLWIAFPSSGTVVITLGSSFENGAVTLAGTITTPYDFACKYNVTTSKWRVMAAG